MLEHEQLFQHLSVCESAAIGYDGFVHIRRQCSFDRLAQIRSRIAKDVVDVEVVDEASGAVDVLICCICRAYGGLVIQVLTDKWVVYLDVDAMLREDPTLVST